MKNLKSGDCFAIWHGLYAGKSMVYIESIGNENYFLILTSPFRIGKFTTKCLEKATEDIILDENGKIPGYIDFVENIPENVLEIIKAQYIEEKKNKNFITDLFQHRK